MAVVRQPQRVAGLLAGVQSGEPRGSPRAQALLQVLIQQVRKPWALPLSEPPSTPLGPSCSWAAARSPSPTPPETPRWGNSWIPPTATRRAGSGGVFSSSWASYSPCAQPRCWPSATSTSRSAEPGRRQASTPLVAVLRTRNCQSTRPHTNKISEYSLSSILIKKAPPQSSPAVAHTS